MRPEKYRDSFASRPCHPGNVVRARSIRSLRIWLACRSLTFLRSRALSHSDFDRQENDVAGAADLGFRRQRINTGQTIAFLMEETGEGFLLGGPRFSPNGKKLAVLWNRSDGVGLWEITTDKYSERFLTPGPYMPLGWSPDGNFVYAGRTAGTDIVRIALANPKMPKTLFAIHGGLSSGSVSPDGRKIVVSATEQKSDVWLMNNFDPK
jgi:WD40 repeat protein